MSAASGFPVERGYGVQAPVIIYTAPVTVSVPAHRKPLPIMPLYRARPRSLYYRRRRATNRRRRYERRRLHIGRIRSRYTIFNVKQTQNISFTFFGTGSPDKNKWQAMSLEAIQSSGTSPKPGINLRFAVFGDRLPGTGNQYHYPFDYYMIRLVRSNSVRHLTPSHEYAHKAAHT